MGAIVAMEPEHWTAEKVHRGETIRLADLPADVPVLVGYTFEDCTIEGPAVLMFFGDGVTWDAPQFVVSHPDAAFWELPPKNLVKPDGVIGLSGCVFRRCRFERVSIAGSAADIPNLRAALIPRRDLAH